MARQESDREDILREATALTERAELQMPGDDEPVVVGFRDLGAASVFFGNDPVYQFNTAGQLRRAYVRGVLYKAERGRLIGLRRERSADKTALVRTEMSAEEQAALLEEMHKHLSRLRASLDAGSYKVAGQVPAGADVARRIRQWLATLPEPVTVARVPNVR